MKKLLALTLALAWLAGFAACGTKPALANAPLSLGEKYLLDLDYDQAIAQLEEAAKIEPKNPRIQLLILYIYVHEDYPPEEIDGRLPKDYPFTPPADDPSETPHAKKISWLLAIIEVLQKLNIRDLALELLKRLAEEFPLDNRVSIALHALADELGVQVAISTAAMTTSVAPTAETTTILTTTEKPTTTIKAATTTNNQSNKIEFSEIMYGKPKDIVKALGCEFSYKDGGEIYRNEKTFTEIYNDRDIALGIIWYAPTISFYGVSVGDKLSTSISKIPIGKSIEDKFYGGEYTDDGYKFFSGGSNTHYIKADKNGVITGFGMRYYIDWN